MRLSSKQTGFPFAKVLSFPKSISKEKLPQFLLLMNQSYDVLYLKRTMIWFPISNMALALAKIAIAQYFKKSFLTT